MIIKLTSFPVLLILIPFFAFAQPVCEVAIHVTPTGVDNTSCGSPEAPCATINYAIGRAQTDGLSDIRAAMGNFSEVVVLADGINLWGGFDPNAGWTKNPNDRSTILGGLYSADNQWIALKIENISTFTIISDFVIEGPDATGAGLSTYAVHALNSSNVHLQNCEIIGGSGADGADGDPGTNATQVKAPSGLPGIIGDSSSENCNTTREPGGAGGVNPATGNINRGGNGGEGGSMDTSCGTFFCDNCDATPGGDGVDGSGNFGFQVGDGGDGGALCSPGDHGEDGMTEHGDGGFRGTNNGQLVSTYWLTGTSGDGYLGDHGGGGGGGGGAGGCDSGIDDKGASGGGGGAGGVRAPVAGQGGQHGGSSFGLFAVNSTLELISVDLIGGQAGAGGRGGNGGLGQPGGDGGDGGSTGDSESGPAGDGGNGGDGGNSGGGAGGNGGSVILIYFNNSTVLGFQTSLTVNAFGGSGGSGGTTFGGSPGQNGVSGSAVPTQGGSLLGTVESVYGAPCQFQFLPLAQPAYCANDDLEINWQTSTNIDLINIYLSLDGGGSYELIAGNIPEDPGTYIHKLSESLPSTDQAMIRLEDVATAENAVTSEIFSIGALEMTTVDAAICDGETYSFGGQTLSTSGTYEETFTSAWGCDSLVTLNLTVLPTFSNTVYAEICEGESYEFNGQLLTLRGEYQETFTASNGCDSVVTLHLSVLEAFPSWDLSGDILSGTYYATGPVTADGTIADEAVVTMIAEAQILLESGFHAQPGSRLSARIDSCSEGNAKVQPASADVIRDVIPALREHFRLEAYPNPFRNNLSITYELTEPGEVEIQIWSLTGSIRRQLLAPARLDAGPYQMNWQTTDLPAGMYLIRLRSGREVKSIKVVRMR